jgi:cation-transporting ATPase E
MTATKGLSDSEALRRRERGQGNDIRLATSRSYQDILRRNVFAFINIVLFAIGVTLMAIGRVNDAVVSVGIISMNILIGVFQEVRAKRQLDRIALLTRPKVTLLRDGRERAVDPAEIVLGDILRVQPGDQIVVDGVVIGEGVMEVDESLLTGESDLILKQEGDKLLSGSYSVSGSAYYEATKVGAESYANQLTAEARSFRIVHTPLQKDIDLIIRLLTALSMFIGLLLLISALLHAIPLVRSAQMAAVIAGLVPNGLFLMVVVAYAMGALRIAGYGALIQQANSVESLSNVNVLCMDKTGTLTANRIHFHDLLPIGIERKALEGLLGDFAKSASVVNRTSEALLEAFGGQKRPVIDEAPFSSERKWSALVFDEESARGAYVLGAQEMLEPHLVPGFDLSEQVGEWTATGLRVLLFAYQPDASSLHDFGGQPLLPKDLTPLGVLSFSDELRPALKETLGGFVDAGVELKVISGDDPQTVGSLARQAGLPGDMEAVVSGFELDEMDEGTFERVAGESRIFGRIRPSQKERLVDILRKQGRYVAMIGDGVNDVLSLKKANLGIAMESGSAATRAVADMVLLGDSFSALPAAFLEGQRIVNGMKDILRLFLTRALYFSLLIVSTAMIGIGFPYIPTHATLLMFLTVGVPTFALAVWARPGGYPERGLIREVMHFVLPAALTTALFGLLLYTLVYTLAVPQGTVGPFALPQAEVGRLRSSFEATDSALAQMEFDTEVATLAAQTVLTMFTTLASLVLVIFVEPPTQFFVGGDEFSGDWRPTLLMIGMLLVFLSVLLVEPLRHFFELLILSRETYLMVIAAVTVWLFVLRGAWRGRWLDRFLRLEAAA